MTPLGVFSAMTHQGNVLLLGESLDESQGEFLSCIANEGIFLFGDIITKHFHEELFSPNFPILHSTF